MLWANLNVQVLQDGIEGFLKALRKLPREVKNLPVGKVLDEKMKEFRDSLPLFVDLKHEALRDRCVVNIIFYLVFVLQVIPIEISCMTLSQLSLEIIFFVPIQPFYS